MDISARMQDAEAELKELAEEPQGIINITWPTAISYSKVVEVLNAFTDKYPKIKINLNANLDVLNLTNEDIDFAFRSGPLIDSPMIAITLFKMQPIFVRPQKRLLNMDFLRRLKSLFKLQ